MERIKGGATIWARKTIDSIIFYDKPDKWFKIWFFLVNRVNHKRHRKWERGECMTTYQEIMDATKSTKAQVDMCIRFLKKSEMLTTAKTTRGINISIINYNIYQDLENYKNDTENEIETTQKRHRNDTINKNDNNDNNIGETKVSQSVSLKDNDKDMGWRNNQGDEPDIPDVDMDTGEIIKPKQKPKRHYKEVYELFKTLGNIPLNWTTNTTQQNSADNLYTERGLEQVKIALQYYKEHKGEEYLPEINSPWDLDTKWKKLHNFKKKNG